ncbi:DNA-directed RNA polymerase III subunit RPC7-like [Chelonus insularis]|uniref:DNA-directed RNA polymerase III subunit RPC7-like n=1 Tax=Chelonus insularis TaxID=460826 RepID=UPI00158A00EA|nr:DNA-directed RNA polymerase III subunit RPC7-like [Chelonus insularis]
MAHRGRGRGRASMSISTEQLGFGKGETLPPPVLQPPPKYPPLEFKAPPPEMTAEFSYLLELKRDFTETVYESLSNVQSGYVKKDIERYSDRYQEIMSNKVKYEESCDWNSMPRELKSSLAKRKAKELKELKQTAKKIKKEVDIDKKLAELEKKENTNENEAEEDADNDEDDEDKDPDENVEDEEAEVDEEMDDGTDYVNNYFDNGEGYDDEEDNLDDGPIY